MFAVVSSVLVVVAVFRDGVIYLTRGYRNSDYFALRSGGRGDVTETHIKWTAPSGGSYVPSILHYEGLVYVTNEIGIVTCADAERTRTCATRWCMPARAITIVCRRARHLDMTRTRK